MRSVLPSIALALAAVLSGLSPGPGGPVLGAAPLQAPVAGTEAGVRDALTKYAAALESLDASAVKKIQPSIPVDNMARAFKEMRELKVQIEDVRVLSTAGATARVSCRVTQMLTPRAGSRQTTAVTRVMRLRREAARPRGARRGT